MVRRLLPGMIAALFLLLPTSVPAGIEINLFYGQKELDENDWEPLETQQAIGFELTFKDKGPIAVAVDLFRTEDDARFNGYRIDGKTEEVDVGVRYLFRKQEKIQPHLGGGFAHIDAEIKIAGEGLGDSAVGFWLAGGVMYRIGKYFNLGVDLRYSRAEVEIVGIEGEGGGIYLGVLVGVRLGRR